MADVLSALTGLTLGGSAAVLLLALFGRSKYRARWRCWAWALLCLRLALPVPAPARTERSVQPPIQLPAMTDRVVYQSSPEQTPSAPENPPASPTEPMVQAPILPGQQPAAPAEETGFTLSLSQLLGAVWLAGAAVMLVRSGIAHVKFLRYLRRWAKPMRDAGTVRLFQWTADRMGLPQDRRPDLLVCPDLPAPMLAGLFRPVLLLPAILEEGEDLRFALLHELTHFRRRDILLKTLALAVNAVHWFNPAMWYMVRLVDRDLELACDEDILKDLDVRDYAAYGRAILAASERHAAC